MENDLAQKEFFEQKISNHIIKKRKEIQIPERAYITFVNEESYLRATSLN